MGETLRQQAPRRSALASLLIAAGLFLAASPAAADAPASESWVGLDGGQMGNVQWSVKIARPTGPAAGQRPCLQVGTKRQRNRFDYERSRYQGCVSRSSHLAPTAAPLIVTGAQASAGLQVRLTAVGIVTPTAARRMVLTYENGTQTTISLLRPSPNQEQRSRLNRFRYAAFAVQGTWAVAHLATESASGRVLWEGR